MALRTCGRFKVRVTIPPSRSYPTLDGSPSLDGIVIANTVPPGDAGAGAPRRLAIIDAAETIARAIATCHDAA